MNPNARQRRQRLADLKTRSLETGRVDDHAAYVLAVLDEEDESEREKRPNARHVIDQPPRTKLQAFAEECPEVAETLHALLQCPEIAAIESDELDGYTRLAMDEARDLLRRMAGEEPPR